MDKPNKARMQTVTSLGAQPLSANLTAIADAAAPGATGLEVLASVTDPVAVAALGLPKIDPHGATWRSALTADSSGNPSTSGVLHAVYCGYTQRPTTFKHVRAMLTAVMGSVNQIGEFAIMSGPTEPRGGGMSLTCLVVAADGNITTWAVGTGLKRNTAAFTTEIPAGVHVYAAMRTACTGGIGTQPTWRRTFPVGDDQALWGAASGVIALGGVYPCVPAALGTQPPNIELTEWT
jgi:hypothetical protein